MKFRFSAWITILLLPLSACNSKKSKCEKMVKNTTTFATALGAGMADALGDPDAPNKLKDCLIKAGSTGDPGDCLFDDPAEKEAFTKKALDACMQMPDDMVDCLADFSKLDTPRCMQAYRKMEGLVDETPMASGPEASWRYQSGEEVWDAVASEKGHVVLLENSLVGLSPNGKKMWEGAAGGEPNGWILALDESTVLTGTLDGKLVAYEIASGKVSWEVSLPEDPEEDSRITARIAQKIGDKVLVYLRGDRLAEFQPPTCTKSPESCLKLLDSRLPSSWDSPSGLYAAPDQSIWIVFESQVLVLDPKLKPAFGIKAEWTGAPTFGTDRAMLVVDDQLVTLAPSKCMPADPGTRLDFLPKGCVSAKTSIKELDPFRPALSGDTAYVTAEGRVIAVQNGKVTWKTDVSAEAEVSVHDGKLFTVEGWTVDNPTRLRALDPATGKTLWASPVEAGRSFLTGSYPVFGKKQILVVSKKSISSIPRTGK